MMMEQMLDMTCMALRGWAAKQVMLGKISSIISLCISG